MIDSLKSYIRPWLRYLSADRQAEVLDQLSDAASPGFDFFLLVVLSCSIATFGLITNSAAVIIGAMLVAPFMSPILGLSLASVAGKRRMFQRSVVALVEGALLAVFLSAVLGWLARLLPFDALTTLPGEVLARTQPTPFDLGIALAGGAAASYALAQPRLSAALPGVAIATALMPPLCTVGIGISLGNPAVALGALLLFATNFITISFSGIVVFVLLGFRPIHPEEVWHGIPRHVLISAALVLLVTLPLVALTLRFVGEARFGREIRSAVAAEVAELSDAQLVDVTYAFEQELLRLDITIRTPRQPAYRQVVDLQTDIATRLQRQTSVELIIIPITKLDPMIPPTRTPTPTPGPSETPTLTPTPNPTSTPTASPTRTPSPTFTPSPTSTPMPVPAVVANSGGIGVAMRHQPNGDIIGTLPEDAPVLILYQRQTVNGVEWIEIRDVLNREGWVPARYLFIKP